MALLTFILLLILPILPLQAQDFDRVRALPTEAVADSLDLPALSLDQGPGLITVREGSLARQDLPSSPWMDAPLHSRVRNEDRVRTGTDSRAEIEFNPRNVLRLAPATTLNLARLAQENEDAALQVDVVVESGGIWAELDALDPEDSFAVRTPVLGAAITGTAFTLEVDDAGASTLDVLRGEVRVASSLEALHASLPAIGADSLNHLLKSPEAPVPVKGAPVPVAGPHPVAGPREVSLSQWLVIVKDMQRVRIGADGMVLEAGPAPRRADDWQRWNHARNTRALTPGE